MTGRKVTRSPLKGVRILDLGTAWAVPYGTGLLAKLGAEVIRVESCRRPDAGRTADPANNDARGKVWEAGGRFHCLNLNKLGVTLDLADKDGMRVFKKLVAVSDAVMDNFTPGVTARLGIDYPRLKKVKEDIITISLSAFGATGPWAGYKAYGPHLEALSGPMSLTGYAGGPPAFPVIFSDTSSSVYGALVLLAALQYRDKTGKGQWVDFSEYQGFVGLTMIEALMETVMNGTVPGRKGNGHPFMAPHGCYRCKGADEWIVISVSSDEEWLSLCRASGNPGWAHDERFSDALNRSRNQQDLDKLVEGWTAKMEHREAMHLLQSHGVPAGAVLNGKEILLDPQLKARGFIRPVDFPGLPGMEHVGTRLHLGVPWKTSTGLRLNLRPSPTMGQHNNKVLTGLLGMSKEEVSRLAKRGVIGVEPSWAAEGKPQQTGVVPASFQKEQGLIQDYDPDYMRILGTEK